MTGLPLWLEVLLAVLNMVVWNGLCWQANWKASLAMDVPCFSQNAAASAKSRARRSGPSDG